MHYYIRRRDTRIESKQISAVVAHEIVIEKSITPVSGPVCCQPNPFTGDTAGLDRPERNFTPPSR